MDATTPAEPHWTSEMPTVPGIYLFRPDADSEPRQIEIFEVGDETLTFDALEAFRVFDKPASDPQWARIADPSAACDRDAAGREG